MNPKKKVLALGNISDLDIMRMKMRSVKNARSTLKLALFVDKIEAKLEEGIWEKESQSWAGKGGCQRGKDSKESKRERTGPWRAPGRYPGPLVGHTIPPDWSEFVLSPKTDSLLSGEFHTQFNTVYMLTILFVAPRRDIIDRIYTYLNCLTQFFKFHAYSTNR